MGTAILLVVVFLLCIVSLVNKIAIGRTNPFTIQYMQCVTNIALLPLWYYLSRKIYTYQPFDKITFLYATCGSLISTIGFLLFLTALKDKPVSVATSILSIYPTLLVIITSLIGLEKFSPMRLIGSSIIMVGIILVQKS